MIKFSADGRCRCDRTNFSAHGIPLLRAYCHCTICQAFNQADYADIIVLRSSDVSISGTDNIAYKYHQWPPIIQRGKCLHCESVAIEKIHVPLMPKLTILPAQTLSKVENAPKPSFHMFYHRRIADADDALPKHKNYLTSQMAFTSAVVKGLLNGRMDE